MELFLDRDSARPVHLQFSALLRERIYSQEWGAGDKMPSEHDFMEMYGVSRGTVQKGIQILVDEGLVTREKGRGTYVSKPDIEQMSGSSLLSFAESLRMQDIDFDTKVLRMEIVSANRTCAKKLGVPENSPILYLQRVRSTAGGPLIFMESRLNLLSCPGLDNYDYSTRTLFSAIEETSHHKIGYAKRRYGARAAGKVRGGIFGCDEKAPVLNIDQVIYLDNNVSSEWGNMWLPTNRFVMVSVLQRI